MPADGDRSGRGGRPRRQDRTEEGLQLRRLRPVEQALRRSLLPDPALMLKARALGVPELAIPRKIILVDALPLLGTGKTDYVTLKQWAEAA